MVWIEAILVGGAEVYRNSELDLEKRLYPGKLLRVYNNKAEVECKSNVGRFIISNKIENHKMQSSYYRLARVWRFYKNTLNFK